MGGKRAGAGRPKGSKTRATAEREKAIAASGLTPLDYMLGVLRSTDPGVTQARRDDMAKAAAPYCHPKLNSVEHTGKEGAPPIVTRIEVVIVDPANPARSEV